MPFEIKAGATRPTYVIPLLENVGTPLEQPIPDLDQAESITFVMRLTNANPGDPPKVRSVAQVIDPETATVEYVWNSNGADTDSPGGYDVEFEIEWAPGAIETVPNKGFFNINVNSDLDFSSAITEPSDLAPSGHAILNMNDLLPQRSRLSFIGLDVIDNTDNDSTQITYVPPSTGGGLMSYTVPGKLAVGVGTTKLAIPQECVLKTAVASLGVPCAGAKLIVDINKNGESIFADPDDRVVVANGAIFGNPSFTEVPLNIGDYLTIDVDQAGMTISDFVNFSVMTSGAGVSKSIPRPLGSQAGDIHVAVIKTEPQQTTTVTPPAGWTKIGASIDRASGASFTIHRFWFRDDGSPGPYTWTFDIAGTWRSGWIFTMRNMIPTGDPVDQATSLSSAFTTQWVAPSLTPTAAADALVMWGATAAGKTIQTVPDSMAPINPAIIPGNSGNFIGFEQLIQAGVASGSRTVTLDSGTEVASGLIALKTDPDLAQTGEDMVVTLGFG